MNPDGRVTVPIQLRREFGMEQGGQLTLRKEDGILQLLTEEQLLEDARAAVREMVPAGVSLTDELFQDRRREAAQEEAEVQASRKPMP